MRRCSTTSANVPDSSRHFANVTMGLKRITERDFQRKQEA